MEILAPAGNFECLKAAISGGADAVYVGGKAFSARKNAANFDNDELKSAVDFCHKFGAKIYVALNILIKENEMGDALSFLEFVREIGTDAVIMQDLGLISAARENFPDLKINASTQLTVHSTDGVKMMEKLGASRVVLARETSLSDIAEIKKNTKAELEAFVHGALCMSYSGQCLFSSIIGGRSGNRGACAQPCRLPYRLLAEGKEVTNEKTLLSPKDLCLIKNLADLEKAGVCSLKIEGRMKSPEYVRLVSKVYSDAKKYGFSEEEAKKMLAAFSRGGSSNGYFYGRTFEKMMDFSGGAKVDKEILSNIKKEEPKEKIEKKREISLLFTAKEGDAISLFAKSGDFSAFCTGEVAEPAQKVALTSERAKAQLEKLGDTAFFLEEIKTDIGENVSVSVKAINELRRKVTANLEEKICASFRKEHKKAEIIIKEKTYHTGGELTCEVNNAKQAEIAKELGIKKIYVPISEKDKLKNPDDYIFVLSAILKDAEKSDLSGINTICAQNIGHLEEKGKKEKKGKEIYAGHRLNVFNSLTVKKLEDLGAKNIVLSPELNLSEIENLSPYAKETPEVIAYGRLPLMTIENCVIKSNTKKCGKSGSFSLKDRKGEIFPIMCENCRNIILNSKVIFMADRVNELKRAGVNLRLLFTIEDKEETKEIIKMYQKALSGEKVLPPEDGFTRGHFARGVV